MRDRQPTQPGRVKITPENGDSYFAVVEMADEPTEFGTPPTKENLLSDDAEISLFGSPADRTVSEAFLGISAKLKLIMSDMASITLTVTDQAGNPVKNVLVNGIYSDSGAAVYTNDSGVASGYIAEGSQTISIKNYADLEDISKTLTVVKGSTITEAITATRRNFLKLTESKSVKFSGNVSTVDSNPVGGGGAAGSAHLSDTNNAVASGGAGAGGNSVIENGISVEANTLYQAIVGSGGATPGASGGNSSFLGVTASGGNGGGNAAAYTAGAAGTGNGNGAQGVRYADRAENASYTEGKNGSVGTQDSFLSFTETGKLGGGGGSGTIRGLSSMNGKGAGYGGNGGLAGGNGENGQDGYGGGGGSAGLQFNSYDDDWWCGTPGKGGSGCVAIRIHFDFGDLAA